MSLVRCPECGHSIGEVYKFVKIAREGLVNKNADEKVSDGDVTKTEFNSEFIPNIKFILDAAGLVNMCCRTHVITLRKFNSCF